MSRFMKPKSKEHIFRLRSDSGKGDLTLVGTGRSSYLWAGEDSGWGCVTFSGQQTLRKLASEILKHVPARKKPKP
jgi:hypothetical protein